MIEKKSVTAHAAGAGDGIHPAMGRFLCCFSRVPLWSIWRSMSGMGAWSALFLTRSLVAYRTPSESIYSRKTHADYPGSFRETQHLLWQPALSEQVRDERLASGGAQHGDHRSGEVWRYAREKEISIHGG